MLACIPGRRLGATSIRCHDRAAGHSASHPLREGEDVGLHAEFLVGVPRTRAPHARLDFIEDQQQLVFVSELTQALEEPWSREIDAPLSLHRLNQNATRLVIDQIPNRLQIVMRRILETGNHRPKPGMILRLRGGRDGRKRPAMEAVLEGDHLVARWRSMQPRQFECPFDRFGTAVAKEGLAETTAAQRLSEQALSLGIPGVRHVNQA